MKTTLRDAFTVTNFGMLLAGFVIAVALGAFATQATATESADTNLPGMPTIPDVPDLPGLPCLPGLPDLPEFPGGGDNADGYYNGHDSEGTPCHYDGGDDDTECSDRIDNDDDNLIDLNDPGCEDAEDDDESSEGEPDKQCSDNKDNDGDDLIDEADPGCHTDGDATNEDSYDPEDDTENTDVRGTQCSDGEDNDDDGLIDLNDPGCESAADDDETNTDTDTQCSDGEDNDGDGKIDTEDPGCANADDDDETDSSNGGGDDDDDNDNDDDDDGRSGSRSRNTDGRGGGGEVLGTSTDCGPYLYDYLRMGRSNDTWEMTKLQLFLNAYSGMSVPVTGTFDQITFNAVSAFQRLYGTDVLKPWVDAGLHDSIADPTGYVYITTKHTINEIVCPSLNVPTPPLVLDTTGR